MLHVFTNLHKVSKKVRFSQWHYENMTLKITLKCPSTLKIAWNHTEKLNKTQPHWKHLFYHTRTCLVLLFNNVNPLIIPLKIFSVFIPFVLSIFSVTLFLQCDFQCHKSRSEGPRDKYVSNTFPWNLSVTNNNIIKSQVVRISIKNTFCLITSCLISRICYLFHSISLITAIKHPRHNSVFFLTNL